MERQELAERFPTNSKGEPISGNFLEIVIIPDAEKDFKKPVELYTIESSIWSNRLELQRGLISQHDSIDDGINHYSNSEKKANRFYKGLFASAVTLGTSSIAAQVHPDINIFQTDQTHSDFTGIMGLLASGMLLIGAYASKESRTNSRNRKRAFQKAKESPAEKTLVLFDSSL